MSGLKTYLVAAAMAAYAIGGYAMGFHDADHMTQILLYAAGIAGLRHGITNEVNK